MQKPTSKQTGNREKTDLKIIQNIKVKTGLVVELRVSCTREVVWEVMPSLGSYEFQKGTKYVCKA